MEHAVFRQGDHDLCINCERPLGLRYPCVLLLHPAAHTQFRPYRANMIRKQWADYKHSLVGFAKSKVIPHCSSVYCNTQLPPRNNTAPVSVYLLLQDSSAT
jgi:hypothetical protein